MSTPHDEGPFIRRSSGADSGELATVDLDDAMRPRPPGRGRAWRTAAVVALVALVAAGILRGFTSGSGGGTVSVLPTTTPDDPGLLVESNVNYGTLTLNGKRISGALPLIVKPHPGTNTLTFSVPPFNPRTCRLQWPDPRESTEACDISTVTGATLQGQTLGEIHTIQLDLSGDDLPPDLQTAALDALTQAMDGVRFKTTVPAGDYIATGRDDQGRITSVRAATSLGAELSFTLTPPGQPGFRPCGGILCGSGPATFGQSDAQTHLWSVFVPVSARWQFDDSSGGQIASADEPLDSSLPLNLSYDDLTSSWQVTAPDTPVLNTSTLDDVLRASLCSGGFTQLTAIAQARQLTTGQYSDHGVEGCLIVTAPSGAFFPGLGTPPPPDDGQFVWRFGVLLAANASAHALDPDLPLAPSDEIKTVAA